MSTEALITAVAAALTTIAGAIAVILKRRKNDSDEPLRNVVQMPTISHDGVTLEELARKVEAMAAQVGRIVEMSNAMLDKSKEHHWRSDTQAEMMAKALEKMAEALEAIKVNTALMARNNNT